MGSVHCQDAIDLSDRFCPGVRFYSQVKSRNVAAHKKDANATQWNSLGSSLQNQAVNSERSTKQEIRSIRLLLCSQGRVFFCFYVIVNACARF